jgi:predicted small lipoprotein YifL
MRSSLARLTVLCALFAALVACGSKGPLVMPADEPVKAGEAAQPEQPAQ